MDSMTVTLSSADPHVLIVADGDASERSMWIRSEMEFLAGKGRAAAWVRSGVRVDDPTDARSEAEIRADPAFEVVYVELGAA